MRKLTEHTKERLTPELLILLGLLNRIHLILNRIHLMKPIKCIHSNRVRIGYARVLLTQLFCYILEKGGQQKNTTILDLERLKGMLL